VLLFLPFFGRGGGDRMFAHMEGWFVRFLVKRQHKGVNRICLGKAGKNNKISLYYYFKLRERISGGTPRS